MKIVLRTGASLAQSVQGILMAFCITWIGIGAEEGTAALAYAIEGILAFVIWYMIEYHIDGPHCKKTCLRGFANNKGADLPAHPHRLISAFVIHVLESIISKHATSEILVF